MLWFLFQRICTMYTCAMFFSTYETRKRPDHLRREYIYSVWVAVSPSPPTLRGESHYRQASAGIHIASDIT